MQKKTDLLSNFDRCGTTSTQKTRNKHFQFIPTFGQNKMFHKKSILIYLPITFNLPTFIHLSQDEHRDAWRRKSQSSILTTSCYRSRRCSYNSTSTCASLLTHRFTHRSTMKWTMRLTLLNWPMVSRKQFDLLLN